MNRFFPDESLTPLEALQRFGMCLCGLGIVTLGLMLAGAVLVLWGLS